MRRASFWVPLAGGLVGLVLALALYDRFGPSAGVAAQVRGYRIVSDRLVEVDVEVARDPAQAAYCVARARDRAGGEAGRGSVEVPLGGRRSTVVVVPVPTSTRAVNGELVGCAPR